MKLSLNSQKVTENIRCLDPASNSTAKLLESIISTVFSRWRLGSRSTVLHVRETILTRVRSHQVLSPEARPRPASCFSAASDPVTTGSELLSASWPLSPPLAAPSFSFVGFFSSQHRHVGLAPGSVFRPLTSLTPQ